MAGRWDGGVPAAPTGLALEQIGQGIEAGVSDVSVLTVPFGTGPTFDEAVAASGVPASFVRVPTEDVSSRGAGERVAQLLPAGGRIVVEGGHSARSDCGVGFLAGLLGIGEDDLVSSASLGAALTRAQDIVSARGVDLVCAASTARPLLGLDSVLAVAPDLEPVAYQDTDLTARITEAFARRPVGRRTLLSSVQAHPARVYGSGAGGGVGAVIAAIGGRIVATGDLLSEVVSLGSRMEDADLVLVAEPELASPLLAESTLQWVTSEAARFALPVVGVTYRASLSRVERAQWGLHGLFETEASVTLREAGRRVARTWLR